MDRKTQLVQVFVLPILIYIFNPKEIKIPSDFVDGKKLIKYFMWATKDLTYNIEEN